MAVTYGQFPRRMPVDKLARRYALSKLLETEAASARERLEGPEWDSLHHAFAAVQRFVDFAIGYGEEGVAAYLAQGEPAPAPTDAAQTEKEYGHVIQ